MDEVGGMPGYCRNLMKAVVRNLRANLECFICLLFYLFVESFILSRRERRQTRAGDRGSTPDPLS